MTIVEVVKILKDFGMHVILQNDNTCWFAFEYHGKCLLGSAILGSDNVQFKLHAVVPWGTDFYSEDLITIIYNGSEVPDDSTNWFNDFISSYFQ